jgi:hypothetical protein
MGIKKRHLRRIDFFPCDFFTDVEKFEEVVINCVGCWVSVRDLNIFGYHPAFLGGSKYILVYF